MKGGRISIGWDSCKLFEHIFVRRCYKCYGFGHIAKDCSGQKVCSRCSLVHENDGKECKSKSLKCINCINAKIKSVNVNHGVFDNNCPVYKKYIEKRRKFVVHE